MFRQFSICLVTMSTAMLALAGISRADGYTTRIETRPVYGATTTIEHGVRVIRPLPPVRQVIINPNRTPLSLGFNETNVYDYSANYSDDYGRVRHNNVGAYGVDGPIYSYPAFGRRFGRGHGRFGRRFPGHGGHGHPGIGHAGPQHGGAIAGPGH
ncbi:MAG TPA: hypothetical protein VIF13_04925 [Hyphomicrobium sp.]|jgi:hypothetical protein